MPLSDEDKKRIEEEEYRKHVQSQLQDTPRVDVNLKNDQRIETHGVGREMYGDAKAVGYAVGKTAAKEVPIFFAALKRIMWWVAGGVVLVLLIAGLVLLIAWIVAMFVGNAT